MDITAIARVIATSLAEHLTGSAEKVREAAYPRRPGAEETSATRILDVIESICRGLTACAKVAQSFVVDARVAQDMPNWAPSILVSPGKADPDDDGGEGGKHDAQDEGR